MSATHPTVGEIAAALEKALQTIAGLHTFPYLPDVFTPPVALVDIESVVYSDAFGSGDVVHTFTVFVIVSRASDRVGIQTLETYMSQDGNPGSIHGAIEADQTLGGVVSTLVCERSGPIAAVTIGGSEVVYITCPFTVVVHA